MVPSHLPGPVSSHILAGPAKGRHQLREKALGSPQNGGVCVLRPSLHPRPLPQYFLLLLVIFLLEIIAGVLAYVYYQQVRDAGGPHWDVLMYRRALPPKIQS